MRSWDDNEEEGERGGQEEERKRALEKHSSISREQQRAEESSNHIANMYNNGDAEVGVGSIRLYHRHCHIWQMAIDMWACKLV